MESEKISVFQICDPFGKSFVRIFPSKLPEKFLEGDCPEGSSSFVCQQLFFIDREDQFKMPVLFQNARSLSGIDEYA